MRQVNLEKSKLIIGGGISFSGAVLNAIKGCITTIVDIGRTVGSAIRRIGNGNLCSL